MNQEFCPAHSHNSRVLFSGHSTFLPRPFSETFRSHTLAPKETSSFSSCHSRLSSSDPKLPLLSCGRSIGYATILLILLHSHILVLFFSHWKRPWRWERLKAGGGGDDRGWDGWMASQTQWTWVLASSEMVKDRGTRRAAVHGVTKSRTGLSKWTMLCSAYHILSQSSLLRLRGFIQILCNPWNISQSPQLSVICFFLNSCMFLLYVCCMYVVLGWPKTLFRFFHKILQKNLNKLSGQPNIILFC